MLEGKKDRRRKPKFVVTIGGRRRRKIHFDIVQSFKTEKYKHTHGMYEKSFLLFL